MMMNRTLAFSGWAALVVAMCFGANASAQNLVITNARIVDGTGRVIDRGNVVVRDGMIASVAAGAPAQNAGGRVIDAGGKTVMPGYVDAHRHIIQGDPADWLANRAAAQMREFLEAGFTTVLSAIDPPQILEARRMTADGSMPGPRLFAGTFIALAAPTPGAPPPQAGDPARFDNSRPPRRPTQAAPAIPREATIRAVDNAARTGYDYLKTVITATPGGPEVDTLKLIVAEGRKHGMPTITHAVSVIDTLAAIEAGPATLVHTPHIGQLENDPDAVRKIVDAGIPMTSTLAVFIPHFNADNEPLFRDGLPFPWNTISSAGQGPVNARLIWEAGIETYAYGTDTQWPPKQSLADELRALQTVFSPRDIVKMLTQNAAKATLHGDEFGTLEPGKLADIVIVDGDPLSDVTDLFNVVTTIKEGKVLFER